MKNILIVGGAYEGKTKYATKALKLPEDMIIKTDKAMFVEAMNNNESVNELFDRLTNDKSNWCMIFTQVGSGIIPMEKEERLYREYAGRFSCVAASKADEVIRIISGFAQVIKGENNVN